MRAWRVLFLFLFMFLSFSFTKIRVDDWGNLSSSNIERLRRVIHRLELVINSKQFEEMVLSHKVDGDLFFYENRNLSNYQIYNMVMLGQETIGNDIDLEWDISFHSSYLLMNPSTIAYVTNLSNTINYNAAFMDQDDSQHAKVICHEYIHLMGFNHDSYPMIEHIYTAPYAIGDICQYLYSSYFFDLGNIQKEEECDFWCSLKKALK